MAELTDDIRAAIRAQLTARPERPSRENVQRRTSAGAWVKPHASEALGVHPSQIAEATAHLRANGITADFDSTGRLLVTSDRQFREAARACGMYDGRDGYEVQKAEGGYVRTGRGPVKRREELRKILSQIDLY